MVAEPASGVTARRERTDLDQRVAEHQAKELAPCIPTRPRHRDLEHHTNDYAYWCKVMQLCAEGSAVGFDGGGDRRIAGGTGLRDGKGAIRGAEPQREGQ